MSTRKLIKSIQLLTRKIWKLSVKAVKGITNILLPLFLNLSRLLGEFFVRAFKSLKISILRLFWSHNRQNSKLARAGFVLPMVTMVILVVTLLTIAMMIRSFDRAKNSSNYRVNQVVFNAATPAIDRAKAKIDALFDDPELPRGIPTEVSLNEVLDKDAFNLSDETRLQLAYDFGDGSDGGTPNGSIDTATNIKNTETINTAWRFPIDTDNNGQYDSFTIYTILFRSPPADGKGKFTRERNPLESRSFPMDEGTTSDVCVGGSTTSASLIGNEGWYLVGSELKKSFFVYVANVPITDPSELGLSSDDYEAYQGNEGFSALEYQQDQAKIPPSNNAVIYQDDLEMATNNFFLNGRIFTNSNLLARHFGTKIEFRQVSSRNSCFYDPENAKIIVGGNVGSGIATNTSTITGNDSTIGVDLYQGTKDNNDPVKKNLSSANVSVTNSPNEIAYNNAAFEARIAGLVDKANNNGLPTQTGTAPDIKVTGSDYPDEVLKGIATRLNANPNLAMADVLDLELDSYFRNRTRRVPYKEVPYGTVDGAGIAIQGTGNEMRPADALVYPFGLDGKKTKSAGGLNLNSNGALPKATEFDTREVDNKGREDFVGDRLLIGNNLPARWWDTTLAEPDWSGTGEQETAAATWTAPADKGPRLRKTRADQIDDLADKARDGFWEGVAAEEPENLLDDVGGVRIVTGAGVYLPAATILATPTHIADDLVPVWPDYMPQPSKTTGHPNKDKVYDDLDDNLSIDGDSDRPWLQMRATAVYHYTHGKTPFACVSSFYDPTTSGTARNKDATTVGGAKDVSDGFVESADPALAPNVAVPSTPATLPAAANSNNGITYTFGSQASNTDLQYQADLVYPNGRLVNPMLKQAADKNFTSLSLAEQAAVDSTSCALQILGIGDTLTASENPNGYKLPNGSIREVSFLDARQVKNLDADYNPATGSTSLTSRYDLEVEQRQPLEVRATVIDLNQLRQGSAGNSFGSKEYMIPNSGIIYASRDDGIPDASDVDPVDSSTSDTKQAATDFLLDPTRRPNGIMLINGRRLWREQTFRTEEKGLIFVSNLPVYIKGEFNSHKDSGGSPQEEFNTAATAANFYTRADHNVNFACRFGDPRLPAGACANNGVSDEWRPATVISDALTLLSSNFREGYRNEGGYDLRNNRIDQIADPANDSSNIFAGFTASDMEQTRRQQGFWDNDFAVNGLSSGGTFVANSIANGVPSTDTTPDDASYSGDTNEEVYSSYFNNFVTPVQRRTNFDEYLMEFCPRLPVSACYDNNNPNDYYWYVTYNFVNNIGTKASDDINKNFDPVDHVAGTTAVPPNASVAHFPRRIAYLRDTTNNLITMGDLPQPIGITDEGKIKAFPYDTITTDNPRDKPNALWFKTTTNNTDPNTNADAIYDKDRGLFIDNKIPVNANEQPLLHPVLNIQYPDNDVVPGDTLPAPDTQGNRVQDTQWQQKAAGDTIFNLVTVAGDSPSRQPFTSSNPTSLNHNGDFSGG
ncbi:MAG: hypothetical protein F6K10_16130, partial [Moorea sp. SIO2B7]|nr:hypothetical protein [Moorena sp. SIO2B7]